MRNIITSGRFQATFTLTALTYFLLIILLMNSELVVSTLSGDFSLAYKFSILSSLVAGFGTAFTFQGQLSLILISLLTGLNIALILHKVSKTSKISSAGIFLGMAGSGCASCGLPIISLLGLTGGLVYLPWHGFEISLIAIILLAVSLIVLLKDIRMEKSCNLNLAT